jgi:hypothetical protein
MRKTLNISTGHLRLRYAAPPSLPHPLHCIVSSAVGKNVKVVTVSLVMIFPYVSRQHSQCFRRLIHGTQLPWMSEASLFQQNIRPSSSGLKSCPCAFLFLIRHYLLHFFEVEPSPDRPRSRSPSGKAAAASGGQAEASNLD